jgi:MFS family permease
MRVNNTSVRNKYFKWAQLRELALDSKFWIMFFATFFCFIINGPVTTFLPIIIRSLGFTPLESLLLLAPAGFLIGTSALVVSWIAMRTNGLRCYLIIGCQFVSLVAALLLWQIPQTNTGVRLFAVYLLPVYACGYAVQMAMVVGNCAGYTKRSLSSSGVFVGYCLGMPRPHVHYKQQPANMILGNFVGPLVFLAEEAPRYNTGWIVTVVSVCMTAALIMLYRLVCMWENKRRDVNGAEAFDHANEDDLTDKKNMQFRYML